MYKKIKSYSRPNGYWTEETIRKHTTECNTIGEFENKFSGGYSKAKKLGILYNLGLKRVLDTNKCRKPPNYWTKELVLNAAKKFNSLNEFRKCENGAYNKARKGNYLNEIIYNSNKKAYGYWNNIDNIILHTTGSLDGKQPRLTVDKALNTCTKYFNYKYLINSKDRNVYYYLSSNKLTNLIKYKNEF